MRSATVAAARKRPHDAAAQEQGDAGRQQQRQQGDADAGIFVIVDIGDGLAAADEAVVGVEFDQKIELVVDLLVQLLQCGDVAVGARLRASVPPAAGSGGSAAVRRRAKERCSATSRSSVKVEARSAISAAMAARSLGGAHAQSAARPSASR